jgi:hypothetical protein
MTIVVNKEFTLHHRVLIDSGVDQNYIRESLIPTKYFEKTTERLYGANGRKLDIQYKLSKTHVCHSDIHLNY